MTDSDKTRIFVVDDHALVREWLITFLRQQSHLEICGQAEDAQSGLAAMAEVQPDVAIVDLSLKNSSGLDLIKDMAERLPATHVIVLSMHEEVFYAERALRAGARAYVTKRESTSKILDAIREVLAGRLYANPELLGRLTERMVRRNRSTGQSGVESLSDRELDVFRRLGRGQTTREIAETLSVSIKTVQAYSARIKVKLGFESGTELTREAVRWNERQNQV